MTFVFAFGWEAKCCVDASRLAPVMLGCQEHADHGLPVRQRRCVGGDCEGLFPKVLSCLVQGRQQCVQMRTETIDRVCNRADVRSLIVSVKIASAASGSWCWFTTSAQSPLRPNNATSSSLALVQRLSKCQQLNDALAGSALSRLSQKLPDRFFIRGCALSTGSTTPPVPLSIGICRVSS